MSDINEKRMHGDAKSRTRRRGRGLVLWVTVGWLLAATWQVRAIDGGDDEAASLPAKNRIATTGMVEIDGAAKDREFRGRISKEEANRKQPIDDRSDRFGTRFTRSADAKAEAMGLESKPVERMPTTQPMHELPKEPLPNRPGARVPSSQPVTPPKPAEPVDYGESDVVELPNGEKAYRLRYKFDEKPRYFIIEDEYQDRGGVPGLLTFTANASDRYTIVQRVADAGMRVTRPGDANPQQADGQHSTFLEWTVDRFEAKEKAMGESSKFDSLRDTYPVASLRRLGTVPGSKATFSIDRWTGEAEQVRVQPGRSTGPATRRKLSKTTQRCMFDNENTGRMLDDLGALIMPRVPRKIGEPWKREREDALNNFGKSVVEFTFSIDRVEETAGRLIAHVSIRGATRLVPDAEDAEPVPQVPTRPRRGANPKKQKRHDFKIDSSAVNGQFRFDITRGALIDLTLQRDLSLSAEMESEKMGPMKLETGSAHTMRVTCSDEEPAKPIIVGGPKPPPPDPQDMAPRTNRAKNKMTTRATDPKTARQAARGKDYEERRKKALERLEERRQKARQRNGATTQPTTTQPASAQRIRPRPATATQPARRYPVRPRPTPTTQPVKNSLSPQAPPAAEPNA